jgi:hypothetical protein
MSEALPFAFGVAVSPVAIGSSLLLLTCRRALANGTLFAFGWTAAVTALAAAFFTLARETGLSDAHPVWIAVLDLALAVAFLTATTVVLVRRRQGAARSPGIFAAMDTIAPRQAAVLGVFLAGANPKVLALVLGAALALTSTISGFGSTAEAVALFGAIGAAGAVVPLVAYVVAPSPASRVFERARRQLERHETALLGCLGGGVGVLFLADGIRSLH